MKRYDTYKDSGLNWIGDVPKHWGVLPLKYSLPFQVGFTPSTKVSEYYDNGTHDWVTIGDMDGKLIDNSKLKISDKAIKDVGKEITPKGSLLYSFKLSVGKVAFAAKDLYTNEAIFSILPANNINLDYYYYCLPSLLIHNANHNIYGAPIFNQNVIKNSKLTLPSPQEQTQIATYLDYKTGLIDAIIAQKEALIKKLKEQRQAIINEAVTKGLNPDVKLKDSGIKWLGEIPEHWEVCRFRYKFDTTKGLTITKANLQDEGIPCVNYGEIHSRYGFEVNPKVHNLKYVSEEYLETNKGSLLSKGDFVFADTSEDIEGAGNFTHLNSDIPTFAGYHTIIARLNDNSDFRFIAYFMDSSSYRSQIQNLVKGVKVYSITNKILKDSILFFPPKLEQKMIAEYIDNKVKKIFMSTEKLEKSIQKLKEYRQSLISEAVTGKIDVRDWQAPKS